MLTLRSQVYKKKTNTQNRDLKSHTHTQTHTHTHTHTQQNVPLANVIGAGSKEKKKATFLRKTENYGKWVVEKGGKPETLVA